MVEHNHYVFIAENLRTCVYVYDADGREVETLNRSLMDDCRPFLERSGRSSRRACRSGASAPCL